MQKTNKAIIPEEIRRRKEGYLQEFRIHRNTYMFKILRRHLPFAEFGNESDTYTCTHTLTHSLLTQRQNPKKVSKKLNINIITYMG